MRYTSFLYTTLFLLLCSCEHEALHVDAPVPVRLIPSLDESTGADTRVIDQTWQTADIVGVSIDGSTYNQYKPASSGTSVTLNPTAAAQTLYYPVDGSNVTFRAFCPYKAPSSNVVTYNTFGTQNTSASMQAVDLVYHSGTTGNKNSATVNLAFQHKFSKIVITVAKAATVTDALTNLAMTITKVPTSAGFNVSTGVLGTVSTSGTITPFHSNTSTTGSAMAIVPPHAGTTYTGRTITFAVGSLNYSYTIPDNFTFAAGTTYAFNFTLTQTAPVLTSTTITAWNQGSIAWDGTGNSLSAPTELNYYKDAATGNKMVVKTNHTATPGIVLSTSATNSAAGAPTWLTYSTFTKTVSTSPYEWTLTYALAANGTGADRTGYIHTTVGGMSVVTKVTQSKDGEPVAFDGLSNCYMIKPGGTITIPITRAITHGGASSSATFSVVKLWDDTSGGAVASQTITNSGAASYITVKAGSTSGNALIAVQISGVTYWSYHIWVTDYNPYAENMFINTMNTNNNGRNFIFMDRNLGAKAVGLLSDITNSNTNNQSGLYYQWGRKDPFPSSRAPSAAQESGSFTAVQTDATVGTVANTIQKPNVFYHDGSGSNSYDWHWGSRNNELWGHSGGKTVYDPCPAGWRVPKNSAMSTAASPWSGFTTTNGGTFAKGWTWGTNAAYPAAGYRSNASGALLGVGSYGYYWSASPYSSSSTSASYLSFYSTSVNVHANYDRAYGFSVRCAQE